LTAAAAAVHPMDRMYRHQRHIYDLTRKWYLLGRDRMIDDLSPQPGQHVLEVGCGTGRNLVVAARRYPQARFYGIDVSAEMLASATHAVRRAGLSEQVALARVDANTPFANLFGVPAYERIFISYALSMIPGWVSVVDGALAALTRRGELHIVDFGGQERLPSPLRAVLRTWLKLFDVTPCDHLEDVLSTRAIDLGAQLSLDRPYGGYAQHAVLRMPG
jgi:S-adenosylmethionine-diacylgycerolhomoserine-N-methlytransferase